MTCANLDDDHVMGDVCAMNVLTVRRMSVVWAMTGRCLGSG